jgi:hypothetical protein
MLCSVIPAQAAEPLVTARPIERKLGRLGS